MFTKYYYTNGKKYALLNSWLGYKNSSKLSKIFWPLESPSNFFFIWRQVGNSIFLVADTQLYKSLYSSVGPLVHQLVGLSVGPSIGL